MNNDTTDQFGIRATLMQLSKDLSQLFRRVSQLESAPTMAENGLTLKERSSDPANPTEGSFIIWMSDGTGAGDDGDILVKVTAGGVTKTTTLVDFSAV